MKKEEINLKQIEALLAKIVKSEEIIRWLNAPNDSLDNLTPKEAIDKGQIDKVIELINRIGNGVYS